MRSLATAFALLSACSPLDVASLVNKSLGYEAVSFDARCEPTATRHCAYVVYDAGEELPEAWYARACLGVDARGRCKILVSERLRDTGDVDLMRRVLVHEIGHVLGLQHEFASGRTMSVVFPDLTLSQMITGLKKAVDEQRDWEHYFPSYDSTVVTMEIVNTDTQGAKK